MVKVKLSASLIRIVFTAVHLSHVLDTISYNINKQNIVKLDRI